MAEIVTVIRQRKGLGVDCQICGFAWPPKNMQKLPRRCANPECRSMRWDRERYPNAAPPRPPAPPAPFPLSDNFAEVAGQRTCYQLAAEIAPGRRPPARSADVASPHDAVSA